ncbi:UDP-N-acetylglucosamine 2-epimerase (non-hydrolyzing) [Candidatus Babeliales bacterium]|nr:UDP-N-acetylglucosamine 2-epimerase (non-hydrolyzing) [Candidatus Babeliales bacterium]
MSGDKPVLIVVGTRPEGIKMIPVYFALKEAGIPVMLCSTDQHTDLLQEVFDVFAIQPDVHLRIGKAGQDLFHINEAVLRECKKLYVAVQPSLVLVEGDTTTIMAAGLAAFYMHIPIGHVEAGLRTYDIEQPFPEELNRRIVSHFAQYHFAPTLLAERNLLSENIDPSLVHCVGNTVVDALRIVKERLDCGQLVPRRDIKNVIEQGKVMGQKIVLLTAHRRESFHGGIERILTTVKRIADQRDDILFVYPFHPNPHVLEAIEKSEIRDMQNCYVARPLSYLDMVYVLHETDFIMTDSGGIQEEGVSLGKHVMVLREKTERMEGVSAGLAHMVGTDAVQMAKVFEQLCVLSERPAVHSSVYGDGYAAQKIVHIIEESRRIMRNEEVYQARAYTKEREQEAAS